MQSVFLNMFICKFIYCLLFIFYVLLHSLNSHIIKPLFYLYRAVSEQKFEEALVFARRPTMFGYIGLCRGEDGAALL